MTRLDALHAENERLRELLEEAADDLTEYAQSKYPLETRAAYPTMARQYERDMGLVNRILAALNAAATTTTADSDATRPGGKQLGRRGDTRSRRITE